MPERLMLALVSQQKQVDQAPKAQSSEKLVKKVAQPSQVLQAFGLLVSSFFLPATRI